MTDPTINETGLNQSEVSSAGVVDASSAASVVSGDGGSRSAGVQNVGAIGAALSVDLKDESDQIFEMTASQSSGSVTFANVTPGAEWTVLHTQPAGGNCRTLFPQVTWLGGAGAVTPTANATDAFSFISPDGSTIFGFQATVPLYNPPIYGSSSQVIETMPRVWALNARGFPGAGDVVYTHFKPDHDLTVSNIQAMCAGTLAAGATLAKMGLATVGGTEANPTYTTIARTASDTTLFTGSTGYFRRAIVDDGHGTSITQVTLKAGVEYAGAVCLVGTTTQPQLAGPAGAGIGTLLSPDASGKLPRMSGQVTGQTDLPGSASSSSGSGSQFWMAFD